MSCSPPPARSIGFETAAVAGSPARSSSRRPSVSAGSSSPDALQQRRGDAGVPAAVRQHADAPAARGTRAQQPVRDVDQLLRRIHALDPGGAAGRVDRGAVRRQRAGVRRDRTRGRVRMLDRHQHDRLARARRGLGRPRERAPIAEVLDVDRDQLGRVVVGEVADQLGHLDVGLVADGDEAREAESRVRGDHAELQRQVAALRDESDRPVREVVRDQLELGAGVEDAQAVRAEQHDVRRARPLGQRAVARAARVAVRLAGGDHDERPHADADRLVDGLHERARRHREHGKRRRLGEL